MYLDNYFEFINIPQIYEDADLMTFHTKIGVGVDKFYSKWFNNVLDTGNKEILSDNLLMYFDGIKRHIKYKKIFVYLINTLNYVCSQIKKKNILIEYNDNYFNNIKLLTKEIVNLLTIFYKNQFWNMIISLIEIFDFSLYNNEDVNNDISNAKNTNNTNNLTQLLIYLLKYHIQENFNFTLDKSNFIVDSANRCVMSLHKFGSITLNGLNKTGFLNSNLSIVDNFNTLKNELENQNKESDIVLFFWYCNISKYLSNENTSFNNEISELIKIISDYIPDSNKQILLQSLVTLITFIDHYFVNSIEIKKLSIIIEKLIPFFTEFYNIINKKVLSLIYYNKSSSTWEMNNFNTILDLLKKFFLLIMKHEPKLLSLKYTISKSLITIIDDYTAQFSDKFSKSDLKKQINNISLDEVPFCLGLSLSLQMCKFLEFIFQALIHVNKDLFSNFKDNIMSVSRIESVLDYLQLLNSLKNPSSNEYKIKYDIINYSIKIKSIIASQISSVWSDLSSKEKDLYKNIISLLISDYYSNIDNLENFNDDDYLYYIFNLVKFTLINSEDSIDNLILFIQKYQIVGLKTINEKRENINCLNVNTFLDSILSLEVFIKFKNNKLYIKVIGNLISDIIKINERNTWLILRLATDMLMNIVDNYQMVEGIEDIIISLTDVKVI